MPSMPPTRRPRCWCTPTRGKWSSHATDPSVVDLVTATAQAIALGLAVSLDHRRCRCVGHVGRVEAALLDRPAIAILAILLDLLRTLAVGRIGHHIVAVALRRRCHLRRGGRWIDHHVVLGIFLVEVIGTSREEKHRTADPDFPRIIGQVGGANPAWRSDDYVACALRAIPVATGEEIILATVRHPPVAIREAVDHITRAILRARAPAIAVPVGTARPATIVVMLEITAGTVVIVATLPIGGVAVAPGNIGIVATHRFLGLAHAIGVGLDRQVVLRNRTRRLIGLVLRWTALSRDLVVPLEMLLIVFRANLGRRCSRTRLRRLWTDFRRGWPWGRGLGTRLIVLRVPLGAMFMSLFMFLIVITLVFSQCLRTNTHTEHANTCQTPDARFHSIPHCGSGLNHKTGKAGSGSVTLYQSRNLFFAQ